MVTPFRQEGIIYLNGEVTPSALRPYFRRAVLGSNNARIREQAGTLLVTQRQEVSQAPCQLW